MEACFSRNSSIGITSTFAGSGSQGFADGDPNAELFFVGEGPGADEDEQGEPFVGRSGKLLDKLGEEGILTVITETGTRLNTALLEGGFVDRVHLFVSPQIMGSDAVPAFRGMHQAIRMGDVEVVRYGNDLGLCSLLKDPWAS